MECENCKDKRNLLKGEINMECESYKQLSKFLRYICFCTLWAPMLKDNYA